VNHLNDKLLRGLTIGRGGLADLPPNHPSQLLKNPNFLSF